jgi:hypothetical protein
MASEDRNPRRRATEESCQRPIAAATLRQQGDAKIAMEEVSITDDADIDAIAATLRADIAESGMLLDVLALKFEDALPSLTVVERYGGFGRNRGHVKRIAIRLDDQLFALRRHHHLEATVAHVVGGIVLSTDELEAHAWMTKLVACMAELSNDQTRIREALDRLVIGPRD